MSARLERFQAAYLETLGAAHAFQIARQANPQLPSAIERELFAYAECAKDRLDRLTNGIVRRNWIRANRVSIPAKTFYATLKSSAA